MRSVFARRPSVAPTGASRTRRRWRAAWPVIALSVGLIPFAGCTAAQRQGQSSSYVIVQSIQGASGANPGEFGGTLASDVQTLVDSQVGEQTVKVPTIYEDVAQVSLILAMKNPVGPEPTPMNSVTFNRYRVTYTRADGRNTPGVDVPFPFDGGLTATVTETATTVAFTVVRIQSKMENPLVLLVGGGGARAISTIAQVTLYGADQAGREVTATGNISINFADWGDPQ